VGGDEQRLEPVLALQLANAIAQRARSCAQAEPGRIAENPRLKAGPIHRIDHCAEIARRAADAVDEKHRNARRVIGLEDLDPRTGARPRRRDGRFFPRRNGAFWIVAAPRHRQQHRGGQEHCNPRLCHAVQHPGLRPTAR
jgi:hypothetical protein